MVKIETDEEETNDVPRGLTIDRIEVPLDPSSEDDEETTEEESDDDRSVHYQFCSSNFFTGVLAKLSIRVFFSTKVKNMVNSIFGKFWYPHFCRLLFRFFHRWDNKEIVLLLDLQGRRKAWSPFKCRHCCQQQICQ